MITRTQVIQVTVLLATALAGSPVGAGPQGGEALGWLELPAVEASSETMLPFTLEAMADAIALGRVGEPVDREGGSWIRLTVEEVLSGPLATGDTRTQDEMPYFGCMPPPDLPRPSDVYRPGSAAVLYLQGSPGTWRILALIPLESDEVGPARERILLFLRASEPETAGDLVLEPMAPLPQPVLWALTHHPNAAALELVAEHLPPLVDAVCAGRSEAQSWLVERLPLIGDAASEPLAQAWPCLELRWRAFALDAVGHEIDPAREHPALRRLLLAELDREDGAQDRHLESATARALGRLGGAEAVEGLRRALARRAGQRAAVIVQALARACEEEPVEPCGQAGRDLLALLAAAAVEDPEESGEMTLLRTAVRHLVGTFGDEETRTRLRGIVAQAPESWVAAEIRSRL